MRGRVQHLHADLSVPGSIPAGRNLSNRKLCSIAHSLSLSLSSRNDMNETLKKGRNIANFPSIYN